MTEAYLLSRDNSPPPPFQFAFGTDVGFFPWLEGEGAKQNSLRLQNQKQRGLKDKDVEVGPGDVSPAAVGLPPPKAKSAVGTVLRNGHMKGKKSKDLTQECEGEINPNKYRLERFGTAMSGTGSWEAPGAILNGGSSVPFSPS